MKGPGSFGRIVAWTLACFFVMAGGIAVWWWLSRSTRLPSGDRVAIARLHQDRYVQQLFRDAGVAYPPGQIYLRAFKQERRLELWAAKRAGAPFVHVHNFVITGSSGHPGPKRREGDGQVPEGFYVIDLFNPESRFFLSLRLNYPNASDRLRSDPAAPGFDIYLHGGSATVGCLPLGDEGIAALYLVASDTTRRDFIPVHIFPSGRSGERWEDSIEDLARADPALAKFWSELAPAVDLFDRTRHLPDVQVGEGGEYLVSRPR